MRPQGQCFHDGTEAVTDGEVERFEVESASFDLGEVEDVVEHCQERLDGRLHHLEVLPLLGSQLGIKQESRHANDTVHGGADLMAHIG